MGRITAGAGSTKKAEQLRFCYRLARLGLLVAIIFSVLNCIFTFFGSVFYSEFSFSFPQAMVDNGRFYTGLMYTAEEYAQMGWSSSDFLAPEFMLLDGGLALLGIGAVTACYFISKKHVGGMIAAAVLLGADIIFEIYWYDIMLAYTTEYILPGLLLAAMIVGIVSRFRLSFIEWMGETPTAEQTGGAELAPHPDTAALHAVDYAAKGKIIMIYDIAGYTVGYRRVGRINELIINKMVYDTLDTGAYEQPHELCAYVDGHEFVVGTGADAQAFIRFDGEVVRKKQR